MDDIVTRLRNVAPYAKAQDAEIVDPYYFSLTGLVNGAADEIEYWRKQTELWKRAARCWLNVAHRFGTVTPDQARDAINEAEEHERR